MTYLNYRQSRLGETILKPVLGFLLDMPPQNPCAIFRETIEQIRDICDEEGLEYPTARELEQYLNQSGRILKNRDGTYTITQETKDQIRRHPETIGIEDTEILVEF